MQNSAGKVVLTCRAKGHFTITGTIIIINITINHQNTINHYHHQHHYKWNYHHHHQHIHQPPSPPLSGQQDNQPAVHQVIFFPNCDTEQNPDQRCPKEKKNIAGLITIIIIIKILNIITLLIVKGEDDDL